MAEDILKLEKKDSIAWLTLNRPGKGNAMSPDLFKGLTTIFNELSNDPETKVVVVKAEGKHFTTGLDLMAAATIFGEAAKDKEKFRKVIIELQESMNVIEQCRKPVIGAAHGICIGAGVDLMAACDIRLAAQDTTFSIKETKMAIIADLGSLQRVPKIIGHGWFNELALTGRDFSAEEALKMGFVTHVLENKEALYKKAEDLAVEIAGCSSETVQGVKEVITFSRDNGVYPGLAYVAQKNAAILPSDDLQEAVMAFMEKRKPVFK